MPQKTIDIAAVNKWPLIKCKKCRMEFVLIAVFTDRESDTLSTMNQVSCYFCPYCGGKQ